MDSVVIVVLVDHDDITQLYYFNVRIYFTLIGIAEYSTLLDLSDVSSHFS